MKIFKFIFLAFLAVLLIGGYTLFSTNTINNNHQSKNTTCPVCPCSNIEYEKLKNTVVLVGYKNSKNDQEGYLWIGSGGVAVVNNLYKRVYVLTAKHVVDHIVNYYKSDVYVCPSHKLHKNPKQFLCKVVQQGKNEDLDFALLEVKCSLDETYTYFTNSLNLKRNVNLKELNTIFCIGNMLADYGELSVGVGRVVNSNPVWPKYHVYADYASLPGSSGSPVFNLDGTVIGIHVATLYNRVSLFVNINVVREELEKEGFGFLWQD